MGLKEHQRHSKRVTSTRRWQSIRHAVLERDGWACVDCGDQRRLEIDHIKPVRTHPELAFDPDNCAARCGPCHTRKTRVEVGHKPVPKDRQEWRKNVLTLEREGKQPNEHKENTHA